MLSDGYSSVFQKQGGRETGCGGRLQGGAGLLFTEDSPASIRAMLFLPNNSPSSIRAGHVKRVHAMLLQKSIHELQDNGLRSTKESVGRGDYSASPLRLREEKYAHEANPMRCWRGD